LSDSEQGIDISNTTVEKLKSFGINDFSSVLPSDLFNWNNLLTLKGFLFFVFGGFFIGFGTRYAGGCTSGHSIMGISNLQLPSLVATVFFMAGGFFSANILIPLILKIS